MGAQHDLQKAGEVFFRKKFGCARHASALIRRNLQKGRVAAGNLGHHGIAQEAHDLPGEVRGALAFSDEFIHQPQDLLAGVRGHRLHHFFQHLAGNGAHQLLYHVSSQCVAAAGDGLVHDGERIAHRAVAGLGQQGNGIAVGLDLFLFGDGGLTALGANFVNMGLIGSAGGYAIYLPIRRAIGPPRGDSPSPARRIA